MALFLLNISVDTADPNPEYIPEDLSINDQESIIEIVVEEILGYENAIKEYDDNDSEDYNKKTNISIDLSVRLSSHSTTYQPTLESKKQVFPEFDILLSSGFSRLETPPPKF